VLNLRHFQEYNTFQNIASIATIAMKNSYRKNKRTINAQLQEANRYTKKIVLPENVRIAQSRINIKSNEQQRTLRKELRQAGILSRMGNSVFLTPEKNEYKVRVTDAVVNGLPYEFRTVTGTSRKITNNIFCGWHFPKGTKIL
jgi:lipopolysaccharide export system protein LptA